MIKKRKRDNGQGNQKKRKLDIKKIFPRDIALKIAAEYLPAPYVDHDGGIFFNITTSQLEDGRINIYMCTYLDRNGKVLVERKYSRELEFALGNIARSLRTTVNSSNIEFLPTIVYDHQTDSAGLIGPLTSMQFKMSSCRIRCLTSWGTTSKRRVCLLERTNNKRNIDYIEGLIRKAIKQVKTKNQILIESVIDKKWNQLEWERTPYSRSGLCKRIMWIQFRKPRLLISKILSKSYNCKNK